MRVFRALQENLLFTVEFNPITFQDSLGGDFPSPLPPWLTLRETRWEGIYMCLKAYRVLIVTKWSCLPRWPRRSPHNQVNIPQFMRLGRFRIVDHPNQQFRHPAARRANG